MTGRVIAGRYNLQHPIGRGAMGVVWRARDQLLDREVAIKEVVISAMISADERRNAYRRTLREARTAARLSHRGVVTVYDVVEEDGRPWIVMELVPSQSLDQVLAVEGRLLPARAGRIGQQLLSALAAAHAAGVLHRDVKPSNVLISPSRSAEGWDERAVLTDFGIAQFEGDPRLTQTGMVMGSPGFTAPERIRGGDATSGSDLWSLGATIYAAVEGRGPYEQRGGAITTMSAIINEDAPVAPHAGSLAPLIASLLRREPSARPSASAAARMFAQVLSVMTDAAPEPHAGTHPVTIRATYVAAPASSSPVTAPEDSAPDQAAEASVTDDKGGTADSGGQDSPAEGNLGPEDLAADAPDSRPAHEKAADNRAADNRAAEDESSADKAADDARPVSAEAVEPAREPADAAAPGSVPEPLAADASAVDAHESDDDGRAESKAEREPATAAPTVATPQIAVAAAAVAADVAVADPKPPSSTPLDARPAAEPARAGAETVIGGRKPVGYQPTQFSMPAARDTPPAPAAPKSVEPKTVEPKALPPRPVQPTPPQPKPGPTFTAAKPANRPAPSFTAGAPVPPVRSQGGVGQGGAVKGGAVKGSAGQGYPQPAPPSGSQYPPPSGQYPPSGAQYGGPSQPRPDLAAQYVPGSGGGSTTRTRARGRQFVWVAVAVLVAAAIGIGAALALNGNGSGSGTGASSVSGTVQDVVTNFQSVDALNSPSTALPAGWRAVEVQPTAAGSTAGFSVDLPPGWTQTQSGLGTDFTGPGDLLLEIDLTAQGTSDMLTAAQNIEHQQVAVNKKFPGYQQENLQAVAVRNTEGAFWKFTWKPAGIEYIADDILFAKATSAGTQDYAVYIRSPESTFGKTSLPLFDRILRTFQTVPITPTQPLATSSTSTTN
jgi:eukaryotic-like serine/threonine-protein kinase